MRKMGLSLALGLAALAVMTYAPWVSAQDAVEAVVEEAPTISEEMYTINNTWMMVATFLVFIMHLGFATLESGLCRAKNAVNILFKNTAIPCIGLITYAIAGFAIMYPGENWTIPEYLALPSALGIFAPEDAGIGYYNGQYTFWTDFLFQAMFAATAATIVSGAVAERVKLLPFLIFSVLYVGIIYPIAGSWKWGGGFLGDMGFWDFAGSTLVHSVGGWAALVGILFLGPRHGKYAGGESRAMPGHSMPLAVIGVFLLWLGWFGFNGGSVLSAAPEAVSYVLVTTSLAAASGGLAAIVTTWIVQKKPDLSMALNGILAGLVGITAGADVVGVLDSVIIGVVAGILVVLSVLGFDKIKIDDPVGAVSVHLVCGIWGTLAVGIFAADAEAGRSFVTQLIGVGAYAVICIVGSAIIFAALKFTVGLRVSEKEELRGLDIDEHGMEAYGGFQIFS